MTKIRFDNGSTVSISGGFVQAATPELTAIIDTLAATLPVYDCLPFELDADYYIARGIIEKIGVGKIVRRDKVKSSGRRPPRSTLSRSPKRAAGSLAPALAACPAAPSVNCAFARRRSSGKNEEPIPA